MKFWEAMKALEEGKKVRGLHWQDGEYLHRTEKVIINEIGKAESISAYVLNVGKWEIVEEPELYWQWRIKSSGVINRAGLQKEVKGMYQLEKHAGPWIKTEDGFKKADNWEQF